MIQLTILNSRSKHRDYSNNWVDFEIIVDQIITAFYVSTSNITNTSRGNGACRNSRSKIFMRPIKIRLLGEKYLYILFYLMIIYGSFLILYSWRTFVGIIQMMQEKSLCLTRTSSCRPN